MPRESNPREIPASGVSNHLLLELVEMCHGQSSRGSSVLDGMSSSGRYDGALLDRASAGESEKPADGTLSLRTHAQGQAWSAFLPRLLFARWATDGPTSSHSGWRRTEPRQDFWDQRMYPPSIAVKALQARGFSWGGGARGGWGHTTSGRLPYLVGFTGAMQQPQSRKTQTWILSLQRNPGEPHQL